MQINREIVYQPIDTFVLPVQITPTPLSGVFTKVDLIDSFILSLDAAAANNVFLGNSNVTINTGIEIVAGAGPINFIIENQRQHYELQEPLLAIAATLQCEQSMPRSLPFIVWDLAQIYLVAVAATNVRVSPFRSQFI